MFAPQGAEPFRVNVADCHGKSVGSVFLGDFREIEKYLQHFLDLLLGSTAMADHCLLNLEGGVFEDRQAGIDPGHNCSATGLTELEGALYISGEENILDSHGFRAMLSNNRRDAAVDVQEPQREIPARISEDCAVVHVDQAVAFF